MASFQQTVSGVNKSSSAKRLRKILSLDGGGIRGLSSIIILGYLMDQLSEERGCRVEPWEEFDMIGGTSTGGITAIMLGRLRMSIDECENAYAELADAVFAPRRANMDPRRVTDFLKANGKFDEQPLEAMIKKRISDANLDENALLHDDREDACKVFVSVVRAEDGSPSVVRSYPSGRLLNRLLRHCKIWEAARATSAASTFFDPITIGPHGTKFVDGGLRYNNPIDLVDKESRNIWPDDERLVISIGTGDTPGGSFEGSLKDLVDRLKEISTDTQITSDRFFNTHSSMVRDKRLFRYNVHGLGAVGLDESRARPSIVAKTEYYLESPEVLDKSEDCISTLALGGPRIVVFSKPQMELDANLPADMISVKDEASCNEVLKVESSQTSSGTSAENIAPVSQTVSAGKNLPASESSQDRASPRTETNVSSGQKDANDTIINNGQATTMHTAAWNGDIAAVDRLRSLGQDIGGKDKEGNPPIHYAAENGQIAMVDHLCRLGQKIDIRNEHRSSLMHFAARGGQVAMVEHLRSLGLGIDIRNKYGATPMHTAAWGGSIAMVDHLLLFGLDIGVKNNDGQTLIHAAALCGQIEMINHLLSLDQDIDAKDDFGRRPIHFAALTGQVAMVDHFLSLGQDIDVRDNYGQTLMHFAAGNGQIKMIDHLLSLDQDTSVKDEHGRRPIHVAAWHGQVATVDHFLLLGQDIGVRDAYGKTLMHYAAWKGQVAMVDHLHSLGLSLDAKDKKGKTPRSLASEDNQPAMVDHLLKLEKPTKTKSRMFRFLSSR